MDAQPGWRADRPATRRLKDISHLYISTSRRNAARVDPAWQPAARRALRIVVDGPASAASRAELVANLALTFAKLGRSVLLLDLDPRLPNVGFRLGLAPRAYLAALNPDSVPSLEAAFLGTQVLCGWAGRGSLGALPEALRDALRAADCVIAVLPRGDVSGVTLRDLGAYVPAAALDTTMTKAAARSPMIGAWMATAHRPVVPIPQSEPGPPADAALWVEDESALAESSVRPEFISGVPVRSVVCGVSGDGRAAWARIPAARVSRWPIAMYETTDPMVRLFEGLAQSLLAGPSSVAGAHAR